MKVVEILLATGNKECVMKIKIYHSY